MAFAEPEFFKTCYPEKRAHEDRLRVHPFVVLNSGNTRYQGSIFPKLGKRRRHDARSECFSGTARPGHASPLIMIPWSNDAVRRKEERRPIPAVIVF